MKITLKFLKKFNACVEGIKFVEEKGLIGMEAVDFIEKLIELDKTEWANWLTTRVLDKINRVRYAVFAAEQVLHIFEEKYPDDKHPRKAIEAAKAYINNPSTDTANTADAYADDVIDISINTAYNPNFVTPAAHAAHAAAYAASTASNAYFPYASSREAMDAAYAARYATKDNKILIKIIRNGIKILKEVK